MSSFFWRKRTWQYRRVCCGTLFLLDPIDESQSLKCICHDNNDMVRSVCTGLEFIKHFGAQSLHSTVSQDSEMMVSNI